MSFELLYRDYVPGMVRLAVRRFHLCREDAEALVHDILIGYLANPAVVRGPLNAYFAGAVCNAAQNYWRKRKVEERLPDEMPPAAADDDERLATNLALAAVLERLPARERDILRRHYLEGQSVTEIAQDLALEAGHVRVLLHRSRTRARRLFDSLTSVVR